MFYALHVHVALFEAKQRRVITLKTSAFFNSPWRVIYLYQMQPDFNFNSQIPCIQ